MIAFGPVPSRRLGLSLGINTIAHKHCPYACTYCQVGRTTDNQLDRRKFLEPKEILRATRENWTRPRPPVFTSTP